MRRWRLCLWKIISVCDLGGGVGVDVEYIPVSASIGLLLLLV